MNTVPLTTDSRQEFTSTLGEQAVNIVIWWQPLSAAWYLSLSAAGQSIALGRQIASWAKLVQSPEFNGDLMAAPNPGHEQDTIGRQAWGATHQLVYLTPAEAAGVP